MSSDHPDAVAENSRKDIDGTGRAVRRPGAVAMLVTCLFLVYGFFIVRQYKPYTFALYDPGWMVSTVMSIVEDGDLDLKNQLKGVPGQAADQTSQGKRGEWYPLHEFLMPVMTVPFYMIFGIRGCLFFNLLISVLLMLVVFQICARHVDRHSAFTATVLTAFPTLFFDYTYSYSLDVFSAFLLILAFWIVLKGKALLGGFIWGLAVWSRLADAVTIVGFVSFLFIASEFSREGFAAWIRSGLSGVAKFLAGAAPLVLGFLLANWLMFGSPLTTSYDRWQHFVDGQAVVTSQRAAFACSLVERLKPLFFDPKSGLLIGGPLLIVAISLGLRSYWQNARKEVIFSALTCISLIILFGKYCNAVPAEPGNRYLMLVVALSAVPLSYAVRNCFPKEGGRT